MTANHLLVRADASRNMGWGHFMRSLAVAQAWRDLGGNVSFVSAPLDAGLGQRLANEGIEWIKLQSEAGSLEDAQETVATLESVQAGACLLDGYHFTEAYRKALAPVEALVACFDDNGETGGSGMNLLINYNAHAADALYAGRESGVRVLLGPAYAPLRREFRARPAGEKSIPETINRILIILGGTDPENRTGTILRALSRSGLLGPRVNVVLICGQPPNEALVRSLPEMPCPVDVRILPANLVELMEEADLAISAGGFSLYELMSLGVPTAAICVVDNQKGSLTALAEMGAVLDLGCDLVFDPDELASRLAKGVKDYRQRESLSRNGRARSDGQGARRIVEAVQHYKL